MRLFYCSVLLPWEGRCSNPSAVFGRPGLRRLQRQQQCARAAEENYHMSHEQRQPPQHLFESRTVPSPVAWVLFCALGFHHSQGVHRYDSSSAIRWAEVQVQQPSAQAGVRTGRWKWWGWDASNGGLLPWGGTWACGLLVSRASKLHGNLPCKQLSLPLLSFVGKCGGAFGSQDALAACDGDCRAKTFGWGLSLAQKLNCVVDSMPARKRVGGRDLGKGMAALWGVRGRVAWSERGELKCSWRV